MISSRIENIPFSFDIKENLVKQIMLFELLLAKCTSLKKLSIISNLNITLVHKQGAFQDFIDGAEMSAAESMTTITVDITSFRGEDVAGFKQFILHLPRLQDIKLLGYCMGLKDLTIKIFKFAS